MSIAEEPSKYQTVSMEDFMKSRLFRWGGALLLLVVFLACDNQRVVLGYSMRTDDTGHKVEILGPSGLVIVSKLYDLSFNVENCTHSWGGYELVLRDRETSGERTLNVAFGEYVLFEAGRVEVRKMEKHRIEQIVNSNDFGDLFGER